MFAYRISEMVSAQRIFCCQGYATHDDHYQYEVDEIFVHCQFIAQITESTTRTSRIRKTKRESSMRQHGTP